MIRSPSVALRGAHGYVVGNDIPLFDSVPSPSAPLIAMTRDGQAIGQPAGNFLFISPRVLLGDDEILHAFWGEPAAGWQPAVRADWISSATYTASLWHATYTPDKGWSPASPVYAAARIGWSDGMGDVAPDPVAGLHAVIVDDTARTLVHLAYSEGEWRARRIPGVELPAYSSIAVDDDGQVYVAYVAPDRTVESDANSVFLVRSPDHGRTWLPPRLISRSGSAQATQVHVLATQRGVHLVWAQNVTRGVVPQVVRHLVSGDGGDTWSAAEDLDIPDELGSLRTVADSCGAVHVTYEAVVYDEQGAEERGGLWYARWDGAWSALEQPFGSLNSTEADLAAGSDGAPRLVWSVVHPGATPYETTFLAVESHLQRTN
ncbi:hypothetical protein [Longimicrobium sp.]|uniref:hypothetical protein n=1 Tax=Longimicrobium sp. TaxID=2029185 RepID=UPI002E340B76|nr:hypothetical protein [Longimicrobium sp.]HEX6042821.1 hypothetical protein [Longimicrobium sp.]